MHTLLTTDFSGPYCPRCWVWWIAPLFSAVEARPPVWVTPPQCCVSSADGTWLFGYAELMHTDVKHISTHRSESWEFPPRPAVKRATERKTRQHLQRHIWTWWKSEDSPKQGPFLFGWVSGLYESSMKDENEPAGTSHNYWKGPAGAKIGAWKIKLPGPAKSVVSSRGQGTRIKKQRSKSKRRKLDSALLERTRLLLRKCCFFYCTHHKSCMLLLPLCCNSTARTFRDKKKGVSTCICYKFNC